MARFKSVSFFKKIHAHPLLVELYKRHEITALFELTEQSSRKTVITVLTDFYESLSPEQKMLIDEELSTVNSVATTHGEYLFPLVLAKNDTSTVTNIDCKTKEDLALYYYLFHKEDIFESVAFFHSFFVKPSYTLYETKDIELKDAEFNVTELTREYKRILDKESVGKDYETHHSILGDKLFYILSSIEIGSRREESLRVVYMKDTREVIISYTGSKYEKLILLDTFLRIVCSDGYLDREQSYDINVFRSETFNFGGHRAGTPFLSWKIKGVSMILGSETAKKVIKLTLPTKQEAAGITPLFSFYKELGIEETAKMANLASANFSLYFVNEKNKEKSVHVPVTIKENGASLCPLYPYHAYARKILKAANIYQGFIEIAKKEKEKMGRKWES